LLVLAHLEIGHGEQTVLVEAAVSVTVQKIIGTKAEPVFEPDDVVGCQQQLQITAAICEANHPGMAGKPKSPISYGFDLLLNALRRRFPYFHFSPSPNLARS
jgi:hypothetical protein